MRSLWQALALLYSLDRELITIVLTSLRISAISTLVCSVVSVPLGVWLGLTPFRGRRAIVAMLNSLMAVPTVVIGLFVYSLISRSGPLGSLGMLFSPAAIVVGQVILSLPIVTSMVYSALDRIDPRLTETLVTLGASRIDTFWMVLKESKIAILSAVLAGFGRVIGEVGVSMMLGGNIRWYTRTITTAIALETSKGDFQMGLALGGVLMIMAIGINFALHWTIRRES